jgi:UDP-GlcNAc3NAcA epimerase
MLKILTIVGARPQFIKAAMFSRAVLAHNASGAESQCEEVIVHTGQHYDGNMSDIFFSQMGIPRPAHMLERGGLGHGAMTGRMLEDIDAVIQQEKPNWVLVYGDTNSTLAGALAAAKLHVPIIHIEAGLRSFNRRMPEEVNRVMTDHLSTILSCPTHTSIQNLKNEGITAGVCHSGDIMYDAARVFAEIAKDESTILDDLGLKEKQFFLSTLHRAENTDDRNCLKGIVTGFISVATAECPLVLPLHPRTAKYLREYGLFEQLSEASNIQLIEPVSFLDMVALERGARLILTDSGGVQKEAYFHGVPCVTLRTETEWVETIEAGWNVLAGSDTDKIIEGATRMLNAKERNSIPEYGNGNTAERILNTILND